MRYLLVPLAFLCAALSSIAHGEKVTIGYVTAIDSATRFDVNGLHVAVTPATALFLAHGDPTDQTKATAISSPPDLYIGEAIEVLGDTDRKSNAIPASRITFAEPQAGAVSGVAIIDLIPVPSVPSDPAAGKVIRADGYLMQLPAKNNLTFVAPLTSISDIRTNLWIKYRGTQRADGMVVLDKAEISPNAVNRGEERSRAREEYDPTGVRADNPQTAGSRMLNGVDPKRIPLLHDDAMQARVQRVGGQLVPSYQKELAHDDPTRIDFRFEVVDDERRSASWSLDSGFVVVTKLLVLRCANDSQLAAILADGIAEILEKQGFRQFRAAHQAAALTAAGFAAGLAVPGAGALALANNGAGAVSAVARRDKGDLIEDAYQQSGRVSLCLMHDAGYDLAEAPTAWWMLAAKTSAGPLPLRMPSHTVYLYEDLGNTWRAKATPQPPAQRP